jgi:peptidoglycan/xylan/chitin deacetylase (PgdA/CDA1 family)
MEPSRNNRRRLWSRSSTGLQVVLYHHITEQPSSLVDGLGVSTAPDVFELHLRWLERRYEVVDLDTVLTGQLPGRALLITFDDGYRSVLDTAGPILQRLGLPSVLFVSAAFVAPGSLPLDNLMCSLAHSVGVGALEEALTGQSAEGRSLAELIALVADLSYERRLELEDELADRFEVDTGRLRAESGLFLEYTDLALLSAYGCEIGNHTRSHLFSRAIRDERACEVELVDHKRQLEEWSGAEVRSFAYPYGYRRDATPLIERSLAASGHLAHFLVESRPNGLSPRTTWNRVCLDGVPASQLALALEVLPRLRVLKDRLSSLRER